MNLESNLVCLDIRKRPVSCLARGRGHSLVGLEALTMPLHSLTPPKSGRQGIHWSARPAQLQSQPAVAEAAREGKQGGPGEKQEG